MAARGAAGTQAEPGTVPLPAAPGDTLRRRLPVPPQWHLAPVAVVVLGSSWQEGTAGRGNAGSETGKIVLNQRLSGAVVSGIGRPGERWQEAAGSAELFLAAAGALGSGRQERPPRHL